MSTNVKTSAGTTLHISATLPATYDKAGYEAAGITYTAVGRITNFGDLAIGFNPVEFNDVSTRDTLTLKGTRNAVELPLQLGRAVADAGQILIKTALDSDADYTFKITLSDGVKGYFIGKVISAALNIGDGNTVTGNAVAIRLNSRFLEVAPEPPAQG
jgi:hypothetical protein